MNTDDVNAITARLAEPFHPDVVHWKPQTVSGNRALVICFVDARDVQDRLDDVLGVMGWQDSYEVLPDGAVVCRLKVRIEGEWIVKEDVGGQSEQPDEGDRRKAAFSDALKRAAIKFGIGRYLYRLKPQWMDYDPQKRRIVGTPHLPDEARPAPQQPKAQQPAAPPAKPTPAKNKADQAREVTLGAILVRIKEATSEAALGAAREDVQAAKGVIGPEGVNQLIEAGQKRRAELGLPPVQPKQATLPGAAANAYGH